MMCETALRFKDLDLRKDFNTWLEEVGINQFEKWLKDRDKYKGTLCYECRWKDVDNVQCFSGHIQRLAEEKGCDDYANKEENKGN